jgi:choline dehydrogenase-like flavoprotein
VLTKLASSMFGVKRKVFNILKAFTTLKFLSSAKTTSTTNPSWAVLGYAGPETPEIVAEKVRAANREDYRYNMINEDIKIDMSIEVDVVIVGSGCGGSVMASALSQGKSVLVLEKGGYTPPSEMSGTEGEAFDQMYERGGALATDEGLAVLAGSTFGGGSAVNWACSLRTPHYVREEWAGKFGLTRFGPNSASFTHALDSVFSRLGVKEEGVAHNRGNALFLEGCRAAGYGAHATGQNMDDVSAGAAGAGSVSVGDRYRVKLSTPETYLKDAARQGCRFADRCLVSRVIHEEGPGGRRQAKGVEATIVGAGGKTFKLTVRAKTVIVSCGSINTPALLLRSKLPNLNGLIGRNLRLHPVVGIAAIMPERVAVWEGAPMTTVSEAGAMGTDGSGYGVKLEIPSAHVAYAAALMPWLSAEQFKQDLLMLDRAMMSIVLCRDQSGEGRVYLDGEGQPKITYPIGAHDKTQLLKGVEMLVRISAAAGATHLMTTTMPRKGLLPLPPVAAADATAEVKEHADRERSAAVDQYIKLVQDTGIGGYNREGMFSAHQMGTCRMSVTSSDGVVQDTGEMWEVQGLYVADASVFPTPSGANPQITTLAVATDMAARLASRLSVSLPPSSRL